MAEIQINESMKSREPAEYAAPFSVSPQQVLPLVPRSWPSEQLWSRFQVGQHELRGLDAGNSPHQPQSRTPTKPQESEIDVAGGIDVEGHGNLH
jgi:hypothetical protein